jgi:hypothetical protein
MIVNCLVLRDRYNLMEEVPTELECMRGNRNPEFLLINALTIHG